MLIKVFMKLMCPLALFLIGLELLAILIIAFKTAHLESLDESDPNKELEKQDIKTWSRYLGYLALVTKYVVLLTIVVGLGAGIEKLFF